MSTFASVAIVGVHRVEFSSLAKNQKWLFGYSIFQEVLCEDK